ncbi:DMT family transporter [Pararhodobacter sp. CCB-MM2]|uniref:DMT family transporter n=1 Tax=Pararhodobacter sp. CCB-MM2 TaxID=1786003 RepID=UPI00082D2A4F
MNALNTPVDPSPAARTASEPSDQRPIAGVLWMVASGFAFVGLTALVKAMGPSVPAPQSAFLRYAMGLVFLLPLIPTLLRTHFPAATWKAFAWRGVFHTFGVMLWFYAMTRIPLAEVSAMGYMNPVWISIGAALFLGEALRFRRIAAIGVAIIGALIILRPGLRELSSGHVAMLFTALFFAASYVMAKQLSGKASPAVIVAMMSMAVTIGLFPFALAVWEPVTWQQLGMFLIIASFATAGHYMMTLAFAAAPITVTQPVTALQLVWSVALGAIFFGEPVDPWVVAGGVMVVSAVIFIALREHQLRLREKAATLPE